LSPHSRPPHCGTHSAADVPSTSEEASIARHAEIETERATTTATARSFTVEEVSFTPDAIATSDA
jgi:hypothetical protein